MSLTGCFCGLPLQLFYPPILYICLRKMKWWNPHSSEAEQTITIEDIDDVAARNDTLDNINTNANIDVTNSAMANSLLNGNNMNEHQK